MLYMGIDPGASGAIAIVDWDGRVKLCSKMPARELDLYNAVRGWDPVKAILEAVHAMPGQGVASTFKFGVQFGLCRMALTAARVPYTLMAPQTWQTVLNCRAGEREKRDKRITKARAEDLFGGQVVVTHAVADALLLAWCCRLMDRRK